MSTPPTASDQPHPPARRFWLALCLVAVLAVVAGIRLRLLDFPLERDEGEYAYAGQLILQGVAPYDAVYNMKFPGTYAAYALIMAVFGQTAAGIHAGLIVVNLLTAALVFGMTRRLAGAGAAAAGAGTYALLSISPPMLGLAAHATHFVALFALGGICLLQGLDPRTSRARILLAGVLLGVSILMKQAGAVFGVFAAAWIAWNETQPGNRDWRRLAMRLGCLAAGGLLPLLLTCVLLAGAGVLDRFWLWAFKYAGAYASIVSPAQALALFWFMTRQIFQAAPGLWVLVLTGGVLLFCESSLRRSAVFVAGFAAFSFLAICPGGYFREHYFLLLLPAAGLLAGVAVRAGTLLLARCRLPVPAEAVLFGVFVAASLWSLYGSREMFFRQTPAQACRTAYAINPFPESVEIARYLEAHCPPAARIAVIGSEPQIYFYSRRRSATGYIYTYALMEPQPYALAMQREMIREIEQADPEYLVFVNVPTSWLKHPNSNLLIMDWFNQYRRERFHLVGMVEMMSLDRTEYRWSFPDGPVSPRAKYWLGVFKNKRSEGSRPGTAPATDARR